MKKWNMIRWILGIPVIVLTLILVILICEPEKSGITRAAAAKSVALALLSPEELNAWEKTYGASRFAADEVGEWYVPYLDYLYENDYLDEAETPADREHAEGFLTYREAARIAEQLSGNLKRLVPANRRNGEKAYPAEDWWLLYDSLLKEADREGAVHTETVCIYGTPENIQGCPAWTAYTSLGTLTFYGLSLDSYVDHELSVLLRDGELIHVQKDEGQNTLYRNVWILDGDSQGLMVYIGDIQRRIPFRKNYKKTDELIGNLADLTMDRGKITKVSVKKERISGKVLSVQAASIELEGYGTVPLDTEYKVLKTYGDVKRQQLSDILVGSENQEFVVAKGKICAVIKEREDAADRIRVLIMGNGFESRYHEKIEITCSGSIKKIQGDSETMLDPASVISVTSGDGTCSERLILEPQDGSELTVNSLARAQGTPSYGGRLEILDTENGLVLVNEIDLEAYLKKVIPSEMPSSYEKEALKAQAVCARTYAFVQSRSNSYSEYGAQIDDSTQFQVYNNVDPDEKTAQAVQETYGKMLYYNENPITAYYFSTSCGTTTNAAIWDSDPEDTPYLRCLSLQTARSRLSFASEEAFASFIKKKNFPAYDASYPLYRWNFKTNGTIIASHVGGVGKITGVSVTERGPGGVAMKLLVKGSEGETTISGQNAIRSALGDASLTLTLMDGKTSDGWSLLPSGFLAIEETGTDEQGVVQFRVYGGGYGHGVGMSQNGAQGMAKAGMGYEEILKYFYDGVTIEEKE
ncbi:SpoIID/LytB domain-containing protein [Clostridium sp. AM33-3]|uniref:SpoIID/LytB domain-containing protein n=1 Tax=Clostridium sp. AM33-3 TaxID=2292304 RepID=UPI000E481697|nr:SpoIID/LytB domain-containing protein [Clostridium sp. AM33-3]RHT21993.1 SpoIID/LytB domain-containing protein [Clostridium sp. AM33-3]